MRASLSNSKRPVFFVVALVVVLVGLVPAFSQRAAAAQVTLRSIMMSNNTNGSTGVTYQIGFTTGSTSVVQGINVDFCSNDPIIGDATCTAPAGFSVGASPSVSTSGGANTGLSGSWTTASANSNRTLELTNATGASINSGTAIIFTLTGVTNPTTTNTAFYARITTYSTPAGATSSYTAGTACNSDTCVDYGGIALSTGQPTTVTAKVMEQISLCVETEATAGTVLTTCSGGGNSVNLGNTQGVLSSAGPYVDKTTEYLVSTNASHQVTVNIEGTAPYFAGAAHYISALTTAHTSTAGTEQFGICTYGYTGYNSQFTPITAYNGTPAADCTGTGQTAGTGSTGGDNGTTFYFGSNTTTTYGDSIATITAGGINIGIVPMLANIAVTTPAGVYTTTLQYIATGQY